jgi:hypothetical protein
MKLWLEVYIRGFREFGLVPIDSDPQARGQRYCQLCWHQEFGRREGGALGGGYRSVSRPSNFLRCIRRLLCLGI